MKKIIAAICFIFALAPLAQAQAQAQDKAAPAAEKKAAATGEKKAAKKTKKEPTEKQKAQRAKMKSCSADAKDKNLKGGDRKKFMSSCLKG